MNLYAICKRLTWVSQKIRRLSYRQVPKGLPMESSTLRNSVKEWIFEKIIPKLFFFGKGEIEISSSYRCSRYGGIVEGFREEVKDDLELQSLFIFSRGWMIMGKVKKNHRIPKHSCSHPHCYFPQEQGIPSHLSIKNV